MFDIRLKADLKNGQPEAFKEVFRLLYPRLKGYCRLFISDGDEVEDIIQDCFLILWEKRAKIDPEKSVESFLFVILRNRCLNSLKEKKLKEGLINFENLPVLELQYLYQLDFAEKEEKSLEEQLILSFQDAIETLPPRMKQIFVRCKIMGQKQPDVADELGISIKAVEKHIATAKKHISDRLIRQFPLMSLLIFFWLES